MSREAPDPTGNPFPPKDPPPTPCIEPTTSQQAQAEVAASKKLNALYLARDVDALHAIIVCVRPLHGDDVDDAILRQTNPARANQKEQPVEETEEDGA
jgi:hypothetical protein